MIFYILLISIIKIQLIVGTPIISKDLDIKEIPFHVSIRNKWNQHICSGAITTSNTIVTSGHCNSINNVNHIVAGTIYPSNSDEPHTQNIKITGKDIVTGRTLKTYLVVFYLEKNLDFNEYVQPIKKFGMTPKGAAKVTGFTNVNNIIRLRSAEMVIDGSAECPERVYDRYDSWRLACTRTDTKEEMCSVLEKTSILLCSFNGEYKLCGFSMSSESDYICESNNVTSPILGYFTSLFIFEHNLEILGAL